MPKSTKTDKFIRHNNYWTYQTHISNTDHYRKHVEHNSVVHVQVAWVEAAKRVKLGCAPNFVDADNILYFFFLDRLLMEFCRNLFRLDQVEQCEIVEDCNDQSENGAYFEQPIVNSVKQDFAFTTAISQNYSCTLGNERTIATPSSIDQKWQIKNFQSPINPSVPIKLTSIRELHPVIKPLLTSQSAKYNHHQN